MSVGPFGAEIIASVNAALVEATLTLGAGAEALAAQLSPGDLLSATVLTPQDGQDRIEIFGHPVLAQLPPDVYPGETLTLQVTGFSGNQILVRNLGTADSQNPPATANAAPRAQAPPPVSPPSSVFVAASVRPAATAPLQMQMQMQAARGQPAAQASSAPGSLDARIAAAQTATGRGAPLQVSKSATLPLAIRAQVQNAVQQIAQQTVRTVGDLLKSVHAPDTPFTRTAAAIAPQAPARVPAVLTRLEAALPAESTDPRIATLKTLIAFAARIDPSSEETLPAQISAFVSNAVEGSEPKVHQLLQAMAQVPADHQTDMPGPSVGHVVTAQARAVERAAVIESDLKSVVLALLRSPGQTRTPALTQALNETLVTITGSQLNALSGATQTPGTIALTLPVFYRENGRPAQIRISSDQRSCGAKLDADNFHIAFILDTAHLGTVAIDLQTTGRALKIDVKTEGQNAASRFAQGLSSLRGRLEGLRYRVLSAAAGVAALRRKPDAQPSDRRVDLRA